MTRAITLMRIVWLVLLPQFITTAEDAWYG